MMLYTLKMPDPGETETETQFTPSEHALYGRADHCPVCGGPTNLKAWLPPFQVEMEFWASKHGDIAYFSEELLVSERFKMLFVDQDLTGLSFLGRAEILLVSPPDMSSGMPNYYVAKVARGGALFDYIASEAENDGEVCPACRLSVDLLRYRRICLEPGSWSGSDVFYAVGLPGQIIVSQRFKAFCEHHRISNTLFVPISESSYDSGVYL